MNKGPTFRRHHEGMEINASSRRVKVLKQMYKKAWCSCKVVVLLILTYCFFDVLLVAVAVAVVASKGPDREPKQRRRRCQRFRLTKQQLCTCITLFCTFLCRPCTTTTWKCLISCFVEDVNTRQRLSSSLPELRYSLLEFSSRKKFRKV